MQSGSLFRSSILDLLQMESQIAPAQIARFQ